MVASGELRGVQAGHQAGKGADAGQGVKAAGIAESAAVVARPDLGTALAEVTGTVPHRDGDDGGWRAEMVSHFPTVSGLAETLTGVMEFEANTEGQPALAAMRSLLAGLAHRSHHHSVTLLPRG
jgi:hypothetical protein